MDATKPGKITMTDEEIVGLSWSKAQFSNINGACVEIASAPGKIAIRDSKDPGGPVLVYTFNEFRAFLDGARNGEFDSLLHLSGLLTIFTSTWGAARESTGGSPQIFSTRTYARQ
jgi:Domain of unknown function (DUF397)